MTLQEALNVCLPTQYLAREQWAKNGSLMRMVSSAKSIEELDIELTPESLNADDWQIFEIKE